MAGEYGKTGYGYRQAVLTVYSEEDPLGLSAVSEIFFRQPFNRLGYSMNFTFQKTYASSGPFSDCNIQIQNPSQNVVESITKFDLKTYKGRPRVEVRAGYSKVQIERRADAGKLKNSLPLIYTGYPFEMFDNKVLGGRVFNFTLFDGQTVNIYGKASRYFGTFAAGSRLSDIVNALAVAGKFKIDTEGDPVVSLVLSTRISSKLFYNGRFILQDILPSLGRTYGFSYSVNPQGVYVCRALVAAPRVGAPEIISEETGMIEQPTRVNSSHWQVKTLFGLPRVFFPGDWVTIKAPFLKRFTGQETVTGCVIDGDYNFADGSADCTYVVAPEGEPVTYFPFLRQ